MVQRHLGVYDTMDGWLVCSFLPALEKARMSGHISRHDYYELRKGVLNNDCEEDEVDV